MLIYNDDVRRSVRWSSDMLIYNDDVRRSVRSWSAPQSAARP